jgi:hypothetical protein
MSVISATYNSNAQSTTISATKKKGSEKTTVSAAPVKDEVTITQSSEAVKGTRGPDWARLREILEEGNRHADVFRKMIERLLQQQSSVSEGFMSWADAFKAHEGNLAQFFTGLEVDEETRQWAQEMISEDGYWGVNAVSERILGFAKAFAGEDLGRLEMMRIAFLAGFGNFQTSWGNDVPNISMQTREAVLNGFDAWRSSIVGEDKKEEEVGVEVV